MIDLGQYALILAFVFACYGIGSALVSVRVRSPRLLASSENALLSVTVCLAVAAAVLMRALVTHDFRLEYAAGYTSLALPLRYTLTAFWGGQKGSLLLWSILLAIFSSVVVLQNHRKNRELMPFVGATLLSVQLFFLVLMLFAAPVFEKLPIPPADGRGLNPLLQNYWMMIHPPMLYLGFVGFSVPFAFAIAALASGRLDALWIKTTRRWTLLAWSFLGIGLLLGGRWAYEELGWGGYWAWDPVENASLMPWLTGTAFLHSVMIQEKKGMLKIWNMVLILLTFWLTIFGTFLTRSGIITSVHAFAQTPLIGQLFILFLTLVTVVSLALLFKRLPLLRSENKLESLVSRESSFLFNNVLFVGIAFAVLWGTIFPVLSEWVRGVKITVGAPFFNRVNMPIALALLALSGVGPLIAWRKASWRELKRNFRTPVVIAVVAMCSLVAFGIRHVLSLLFFGSCAFVTATVFLEFYRGARARQSMMREAFVPALVRLTAKNKRRYGGFVVHLGMALIFVGIAGSSFFKVEKEATLSLGQLMHLGPYEIRYEGIQAFRDPNKDFVKATLSVSREGLPQGQLVPERHFYVTSEQPTTEVALRSTFKEDLYAILVGWDAQSKAAVFKLYLNPLVQWIWYGGGLLALGTLICMLPRQLLVKSQRQASKRETEHVA
ncbi:MAG: heme lyase CcmF/NrfE family subunit [Acidobacteria bacterium]|nr:heme lyase CcmF/NrfE family subunit [Acidobacteriota bacterium]